MRTRFAPSPTGNVHIGNIRVAIFNWLFARHNKGKFLIRIEDTDLERSTPEAIRKLFEALEWLGLDYDEEPVYQTRERPQHEEAARRMLAAGHAVQSGDNGPVLLRIHAGLFAPSYVTEPRDEATINWKGGELTADHETITHIVTSPKSGETYVTPVNWDTLAEAVLLLESGAELPAPGVRAKLGTQAQPLAEVAGGTITGVRFKRRYVFFDDLVLGRLEKPLDSLRNMVIVRSDGSPVFHLANVVDDVTQEVDHILRGNDHVENTYRHLFIFKAIGATPPRYGHFPMIVNASGKPYSKRDGDAYIGDFEQKGYLPEALFNFLALCGWSPGDDRELMSREEMQAAFTLERVNASAAQFDMQKLDWMNQQYLQRMDEGALAELFRRELESASLDCAARGEAWLRKLTRTQRERVTRAADVVVNTRYFFRSDFAYDEKAVSKNLLKNEGEGLRTLALLTEVLQAIPEWEDAGIEAALQGFAEKQGLKMGQVAQPLRIACTGGTVSPGIGETLALLGREEVLTRISRALAQIKTA